MLRVDRTERSLRRLKSKPMELSGFLERSDLQTMIVNSPAAFCAEIGEELLLLGQEVPAKVVNDRIDVLALDKLGTTVVIELKRGADKLQLLQALSYTAMISGWEKGEIVLRRSEFKGSTESEAEEEIGEFLGDEVPTLNERQRSILIAEQYDYQVLATAKWLTEKHGVDIACWKIELAEDSGAEYFSLACVYPPPELADSVGGHDKKEPPFVNWAEALAPVKNPAVIRFYTDRLAEKCPSSLPGRKLLFKIDGKTRFRMAAKRWHAAVRQRGRFDGDVHFWRERLGADTRIGVVPNGRALRINLGKEVELNAFLKSFREEIPGKTFIYDQAASEAEEGDSVDDASESVASESMGEAEGNAETTDGSRFVGTAEDVQPLGPWKSSRDEPLGD